MIGSRTTHAGIPYRVLCPVLAGGDINRCGVPFCVRAEAGTTSGAELVTRMAALESARLE